MVNYVRIRAIIALAFGLCTFTLTSAANNNSQRAEAMLEMALSQINAQQPTQALVTLDTLIQHYPHFQLAHMMRADILFAQANALTSIGAQLSNQQTQSLQAEARARLMASKQLAEQQQPVYVLGEIPSSLKHLITIDLTASRAYLFHVNQQQLSFSGSFYVTQGSKGAGKEKEGDKRTPVGIYRLTKPIPAQKLSSFYGAGALPLDYPNSWDKRNQRTGHGIWLHGTPLEQYSRPPLASDGCVVFSNDDMSYLLNQLDWQATRIITDHQLQWKNQGKTSPAEEIKQRVESWRRSWEQRQLQSYLAFYAADFRSPKNENKAQWSTRKQQLFNVDQPHQVQVSQLLALSYPAQADVVLTEFDQRYQRGSKIDVERKRLWWQQQQGEWLIIYEEVLSN